MSQFTIRPALTCEAEALSALSFRSKAHWGYDAQFMELSRAALTVPADLVASGGVMVAESANGTLIGMASIAPMAQDGCFDLVHLFIEPGLIRSGAGRALFHAAVEAAKARGGQTLVIQADPNATDFYRRMGAVDAGETPSDSIPGRMLPVLRYSLD